MPIHGCSDCPFYRDEVVQSPFTRQLRVERLCQATPADDCPMDLALLIEALEEAVVPCTRCGQDVDGHGSVDGIPVCPVCDAGIL